MFISTYKVRHVELKIFPSDYVKNGTPTGGRIRPNYVKNGTH